MTRKWMFAAVAVVLLGGVAAFVMFRTRDEVAVVTAQVTSGPVVRHIFATGTLQATRTVDVGTQVSGNVATLGADFNSIVHSGQIVATLDPSLYRAALDQAKAMLTQSQAQVAQARADAAGARTVVEDARVKLVRAKELSAKGLIPQSDLDAAQTAFNDATAAVNSSDAQVREAAAGVQQAQASVTQASVNLDHTIIRSPTDGIVLNRSVDIGQTVAAAVQAPVLFSIATDVSHLQVRVDVDQSDIGGVAPGQKVTFEVESYPDETFHGILTQVWLQPVAEQSATATTIASSTIAQTTTSVATVVSYSVMIDVENPDERLRPGMTASVALSGTRKDNATRIPNSALSFRPTPAVLRALGEAEPAQPEASQAQTDTSRKPRELWTFDGKRLTPVLAQVGLSDERWTEVTTGSVHPGDAIVTSAVVRRVPR